ncbi:hypothetical protein V8G54_035030 [Vigna mungo]|uniref:Pentatricopeptide repeat-containing protein n=1 Tax=Vigna mungo TaxID=3915 RepID=A0AAQ3RCL8_VIGMU
MLVRRFSVKSQLNCALPSTLFPHYFSSSNENNDIQKVFGILNSTSTPEQLKQSLKSSSVFLSNELIDQVLKRVRFSHGIPSQTLEFFRYTGRRKGFYHTVFSLDAMLYILGRSHMFGHVWDLLIECRRKDQTTIMARTVMVVLGRIAKVCSVRQTEKSMTDARNVYHSLKHRYRPNLQTFNILLSGWKTPEDA